MIVDEALRLPRPLLAGQIVTRCDRPNVACTAITAPQRACFVGERSENPTDRSFVEQEHHPRRGPYAQAYNRLSLARSQPACKTGDLPTEPAARIERDTTGPRCPIGWRRSIVLIERLIAVPEALERRPVLLEDMLQQPKLFAMGVLRLIKNEPPRVYRRVVCSTTKRPYRVSSGLHRTPPLLLRVGCIRWGREGGGCYTNRPI